MANLRLTSLVHMKHLNKMGPWKVKLCHESELLNLASTQDWFFGLLQDRYILDIEIGIVRLAQGWYMSSFVECFTMGKAWRLWTWPRLDRSCPYPPRPLLLWMPHQVKSAMGPYCKQYKTTVWFFFPDCPISQPRCFCDDQTHLGAAQTKGFCLCIPTLCITELKFCVWESSIFF